MLLPIAMDLFGKGDRELAACDLSREKDVESEITGELGEKESILERET